MERHPLHSATPPLHIGSEDDGSHLFIFHSVISHFKLPRPQEGKTERGGWGQAAGCQHSAAQHLQRLLGSDWFGGQFTSWIIGTIYISLFNSVFFLTSPPTGYTVTGATRAIGVRILSEYQSVEYIPQCIAVSRMATPLPILPIMHCTHINPKEENSERSVFMCVFFNVDTWHRNTYGA